MIAIKPEDQVKRSIIDSLSSIGLNQTSIRRAFRRLINKGKAAPQQAYCLLQIPILKYSHTPDRDIKLIAALRDLSKGQQ